MMMIMLYSFILTLYTVDPTSLLPLATMYVIGSILGICLVVLAGPVQPLLSLLSSSPVSRLSIPNTQLSGLRFGVLFPYFIARSLLRRLGLGPQLATKPSPPLKPDANVNPQDATYTISGPQIELHMPFHISSNSLQAYSKAVTIDPHNVPTAHQILHHPLHLTLLLAGLGIPGMVFLLAKRICPVDPIGSVNVRNRFELPDRQRCIKKLEEAIRLSASSPTRSSGLGLRAKLDKQARKVKRGWEVQLVVEVIELEGEQTVLFKQTFTTLQFAKHRSIAAPTNTQTSAAEGGELHATGKIKLSLLDPALWAKLSNDHNVIHFYTLGAKLAGFKGRIAHGNHVAAKGIEALRLNGEHAVPDNVQQVTIDVDFRRPVFIPTELAVGSRSHVNGGAIEIGQMGKPDVSLSYTFS